MHRYFVAYVFSNYQGGVGNGWTEITRPQPIRGGADITELAELIKRDGNLRALTITGWQKFED